MRVRLHIFIGLLCAAGCSITTTRNSDNGDQPRADEPGASPDKGPASHVAPAPPSAAAPVTATKGAQAARGAQADENGPQDGALCRLPPSRFFDNGLTSRCVSMAGDQHFEDFSGCAGPRKARPSFKDNHWELGFHSQGRAGKCNDFRAINDPAGNLFFELTPSETEGGLTAHMILDYEKVPHPCGGMRFDWYALQATQRGKDPAFPNPENLVTKVTVEPRLSGNPKRSKFFIALRGSKVLEDGGTGEFVLAVQFLHGGPDNAKYKDIPSLITARRCRPEEPCDESFHIYGSALGYDVPANTKRTLEIDWGRVLEHAKGLRKDGQPIFVPFKSLTVKTIRIGMEPTGAGKERHELLVSDLTVLSKDPADCR